MYSFEGKLLWSWVIGSLIVIGLLTWAASARPDYLFAWIILSFGGGSLAHATWADARRTAIVDQRNDWYQSMCKERGIEPVSPVPNLFEHKWEHHYELLRETAPADGDPFALLPKSE